MTFRVTNDFTGSATLDVSKIDTNFADIENKLNGNLDEDSMSADTQLPNSMLANSHYEMLVKFQLKNVDGTNALTGNELIDWHPLPGLVADGPYVIEDCDYYISDVGDAGNTVVTIASGTVAAGAFSATTTHVNAQNISSGTDGQDAVGSLTVASATIPASANNRVLQMSVTAATNALSGPADKLTVILKLRRTNGLRSS